MADNSDIKEMSDDELMEEWTALGTQVTEMKERLTAFSHEHQDRTRKEQLVRQMGGMSERDMELLQEVQAEGIASEEAFGMDESAPPLPEQPQQTEESE